MGERILTVPKVASPGPRVEVTGNEWVSLPRIDLANGGITSLNLLAETARGLVEFVGLASAGGDFLAPCFFRRPAEARNPAGDGGGAWRPVAWEGNLRWRRSWSWVPAWERSEGDLDLSGEILAPPDCPGFIYLLSVTNQGLAPVEVFLGLRGTWGQTRRVVFQGRRVHDVRHVWVDEWSKGLVLESRPGLPLAALSIGASADWDTCHWEVVPASQATADWSLQLELALGGGSGDSAWPRLLRHVGKVRDGETVVEPGRDEQCLRFLEGTTRVLAPGEGCRVAFYVTAGADGEGARLRLVDMRRRGWAYWREAEASWLTARRVSVESGTEPGDPASAAEPAAERLNRNLLFNRFFAMGRAVDSESLLLLASRSPRYYVCGAHWSRDAFLWSFPGLLLTDPEAAREALRAGCSRYLRNAGEHALYLDGAVLYPGFELDELVAWTIALEEYLGVTGHTGFLAETGVTDALLITLTRLRELAKRGLSGGSAALLLPTFLSPSDDPCLPYLTYDNVLVWRALRFMASLSELDQSERAEARRLAEAISEGLARWCVVDCGSVPVYAYAVDGEGGVELSDNPAGSLLLLAYHGQGCVDPAVYANTARRLCSALVAADGEAFVAQGNDHAPWPWPLDAANRLVAATADPTGVWGADPVLSGAAVAAERLLTGAPLDGGLACESVDLRTGVIKTGAGFAACAGWLGFALARRFAGR